MPTFRAAWLLAPLVAWLLWLAALFFLQRRMIFPRHLVNPAPSSGDAPPGSEKVVLETPSGAGLAYYLEPGARRSGVGAQGGERPPAPALVFAHGNAELARDWVAAYRTVAEQGVAVLLVEYPGYGGAPGEPSRESITDVMVAAFDHLGTRPEVDGSRIAGLGRSLGGGAVTELAARRRLAGLVLQSTFTRVEDFARRFLAPRVLVRDRFDNLGVVASFPGPVLVFHGEEDRVIPFEHGRRLADAAERAELVSWPCGHNDCPPDWTTYADRVVAFVRGLPPVEQRP